MTHSSWLPVTSGVPQGSILGPLLFLLYINDLPDALSPNTLCAIFADDTKIYRHVQSHQDHLILQRDITNVHKWSKSWGLTFNKDKCNIISLKRHPNPIEFLYSMDNITLTRTTTVNDLGLTVTPSLKWHQHINKITSKANQRIWLAIRTLGFHAPRQSKITTYQTIVRSLLEYNTVVWNPVTKDNITALESIQRKATNFITCNPKRPSPHHIEYKERLIACKLLPLTYRREVYDIMFFIKSLRKLIPYNILEYLSFQHDNITRVTRNRVIGLNLTYTLTRLETSAHFYPIRLAHLWNKLSVEFRTKLISPLTIPTIKTLLNKHYYDKLVDHFETNNTCTWVTACRCTTCRPY